MISGKEAAAAWIDGIPVEVRYKRTMWFDLSFPNYGVDVFKSKNHEFRIKPSTITLNGIEVPAPFEPKNNCVVYILDDSKTCSYRAYSYEHGRDNIDSFVSMWESEEEIKQVVEALRNVFNP